MENKWAGSGARALSPGPALKPQGSPPTHTHTSVLQVPTPGHGTAEPDSFSKMAPQGSHPGGARCPMSLDVRITAGWGSRHQQPSCWLVRKSTDSTGLQPACPTESHCSTPESGPSPDMLLRSFSPGSLGKGKEGRWVGNRKGMEKRRKERGKKWQESGQEMDRTTTGVRRPAFAGLLFFEEDNDSLGI